MEFLGDPQEEKLRTMQEFLRFWAWSQKERKRTGINPLYSLMMSVRNAEEELKRIEQKVTDKNNPNAAWRGLTLGKPIPIMNDPELWRGHYRDKEVLAMFYLDPSANPRGCNEHERLFARRFRVYRGMAREMLRTALLYFSTLWGDL